MNETPTNIQLVGVCYYISHTYKATPYKDYAGGVPAVDISVTRIYVVSLGKV